MKLNPIDRKSRNAMPVWLAMVAICVQPILVSPASCGCDHQSVAGSAMATGCCNEAPIRNSCCSESPSNTTIIKDCCSASESDRLQQSCHSSGNACHCNDCHCARPVQTPVTPPAIPPETSQAQSFVSRTVESWISSIDVGSPIGGWCGQSISFCLTAQQTCVLLSRFTC